MKTKYLNTKSQWHPGKNFPKTIDLPAMVDFLRYHEYTQFDDPNYSSYSEYAQKLHISIPFYIYDTSEDENNRLYFSNGGKLSKKNPLFIVTKLSLKIFYSDDEKTSPSYSSIWGTREDLDTIEYDKFLQKIHDILGWE